MPLARFRLFLVVLGGEVRGEEVRTGRQRAGVAGEQRAGVGEHDRV